MTPTRLVISPPQQEPSNSVTRRYAERIDSIIRVVFADEEDKLFVSRRSSLGLRELGLIFLGPRRHKRLRQGQTRRWGDGARQKSSATWDRPRGEAISPRCLLSIPAEVSIVSSESG